MADEIELYKEPKNDGKSPVLFLVSLFEKRKLFLQNGKPIPGEFGKDIEANAHLGDNSFYRWGLSLFYGQDN